jgi:hypothetical protein
MMHKRKLGVAALLGLSLSACAFQVDPEVVRQSPREERPVPDAIPSPDDGDVPGDVVDEPAPVEETPPLPPWNASRPFQSLEDGRVRGTIGAVANADLPADLASLYDDGYFTQIDLYALRSDGQRVMLQLQLAAGVNGPVLQPGVGFRAQLGPRADGSYLYALGCQGPDGEDEPFADTPFDEEPCDVGVDTERDPENPDQLLVTIAATFADDNGDCPDVPGGDVGLPDGDNDGDGDLPGCPNDPGAQDPGDDVGGDPGAGDGGAGDVPPGDGVHPLATATFRVSQ